MFAHAPKDCRKESRGPHALSIRTPVVLAHSSRRFLSEPGTGRRFCGSLRTINVFGVVIYTILAVLIVV